MPNEQSDTQQLLAWHFRQSIPFNATLGIDIVSLEQNVALTRLPYQPAFIGDVDAGLWHTSVVIALIDATGGLGVQLALEQPEPIATLDLRTDYLRPVVADKPLFARAECYHVTRYIAFMRGELYQENRDRLTAHCTATFMRTSRGRRAKNST